LAASKSFEEIEAWQSAMDIVTDVYRLTSNERFRRDRGLREQLQRAAVSVPANIAEGFERRGDAEFARFLTIAKGSAGELQTHLLIAQRLEYLPKQMASDLLCRTREVSAEIAALIRYLRKGDGKSQ